MHVKTKSGVKKTSLFLTPFPALPKEQQQVSHPKIMATCSYASSTIVPVRASESSRVVISMGSSNFGLCKNFKSLTTLKNFRTFTQRNIVKVRMSFQDGFNSANSDSYLEAEVVDAGTWETHFLALRIYCLNNLEFCSMWQWQWVQKGIIYSWPW